MMALYQPRSRTWALTAGVVISVHLLLGGTGWAIGEPITDIRVIGNVRTAEDTIRSLAGVNIGDSLQLDTLATVRERLNTSGLFADVNVWWESHHEGIRVNIAVKDKFPWAPVPTASWAANNKSFGLIFVHGNLFGRGKQMVVGGRLATVDSGAVLAYRDPAFLGSWLFWELRAVAQRQVIPEYSIFTPAPVAPWRVTTIEGYGMEPAIGIAWFRRVKTQVGFRAEHIGYKDAQLIDPTSGLELGPAPLPTINGGTLTLARASITFDWRARIHAVMSGVALGGSLDYSSPTLKSDYDFWRARVTWEHGIKLFKRHNLVYLATAAAGRDMPLWWDPVSGGRGYLVQQFRGDTQLYGEIEYHFPMFSLGSLDVRGLGFYDVSALWFRHLPDSMVDANGYYVRQGDARSFNPNYVARGFNENRDIRTAVGMGLRFFVRSVAVPLVGIDAGYGIESETWRFLLVVGA